MTLSVAGQIRYYGPWQVPYAATKVLCSDGRRRYARITGQADTFFTIPASVKVHGKTVSGFLTSHAYGDQDDAWELFFHAYAYGKNGALLP